MIRRSPRHRHAGFTLIEVVAALPLVSLALGLGVELIYTLIKLDSTTAQTANFNSRVDSGIYRLRRDAWSASAISTENTTLLLTCGDDQITWKIEGDDLVRTSGGESRWPGIAAGWRFAADSASVKIDAETQQGTEEIRLPSQIMLSNGRQP